MRSLPRPGAVTAAFWLWLLAAGFSVATSATALGKRAELHADFVRQARSNDAAASADRVDQVADLSLLVVIGGGVLVGLLAALFAAALRAGRAWARVALVLVALSAVAYAVLVVGPMGWPVVAAAGVAVVATVSMCLPESRPWFA
ncbi:hypothetical protein [Actinophytocola sp. NPDC049390]|uniref:hypothetical protein n=1 Tax=Actinophytocola sp. NPDC049390 TaxID=3363894 RepID=UPI0037A3B8C4